MGGRGRSLKFLNRWHRRELELPDGAVLRWVLMADPARAPHAECFRVKSPDSASRLLHPIEAQALLEEAGHPDAEHVRFPTFGRTITH